MILEQTTIAGLFVLRDEPHHDPRGYFSRFFCIEEIAQFIGKDLQVKQGNVSFSARKATLRGLHYQIPPHSETKMVRCIAGSVLDFVVDMRGWSTTAGEFFARELRAGDGQSLLIPEGLAHGFLTLSDDAVLEYLVTESYAPNSERTLHWNDSHVGLELPLRPKIVSPKDSDGASFTALFSESAANGWWSEDGIQALVAGP